MKLQSTWMLVYLIFQQPNLAELIHWLLGHMRQCFIEEYRKQQQSNYWNDELFLRNGSQDVLYLAF